METKTVSVKKIAYSYGALLALITILLTVIVYVANIEKNWIISSVGFIATILITVYGIKSFKKQNHNYITLTQAIKVGLAISAIAGIIGSIYIFIHYSYIQPEFVDNVREESYRQMMEQNAQMDEEKKAQAIKLTEFFTSPIMMSTVSLFLTLFLGFIISMITGAIIKNNNPNSFN